jgi:hypothetical protein
LRDEPSRRAHKRQLAFLGTVFLRLHFTPTHLGFGVAIGAFYKDSLTFARANLSSSADATSFESA